MKRFIGWIMFINMKKIIGWTIFGAIWIFIISRTIDIGIINVLLPASFGIVFGGFLPLYAIHLIRHKKDKETSK